MIKSLIQNILVLFYPIFKKIFPYELYAYLAVGAVNTALNILLFALLYQFVLPNEGIEIYNVSIASYTLSLIISFFATIPTGYWFAREFAFNQPGQKPNQTGKQMGKYFLVVLQGLASDYLILKGLIVFAGLHPTIAKIASTVIVLTVNFLLQKYYTFKLNEV
jgi:putative flippase GtrA